MTVSGWRCPQCGDDTAADEIDRYVEPSSRVSHLKVKCRNCLSPFLIKMP